VSVKSSSVSSDCKCAPGYTGPDAGPCAACAADSFKAAAGPGTCVACSTVDVRAGTNGATAGGSAAACKCEPGFSGPNGDTCTICDVGTFKNAFGQDACSNCPPSTFNPNQGSLDDGDCTGCPNNSVSPAGSDAQVDCLCATGFTTSNCDACPVDTYKDQTGDIACTACSTVDINSGTHGANSGAAAAACTCNVGFTGPAGSTCTSCRYVLFRLSLPPQTDPSPPQFPLSQCYVTAALDSTKTLTAAPCVPTVESTRTTPTRVR
jgi:hypothetical protein